MTALFPTTEAGARIAQIRPFAWRAVCDDCGWASSRVDRAFDAMGLASTHNCTQLPLEVDA